MLIPVPTELLKVYRTIAMSLYFHLYLVVLLYARHVKMNNSIGCLNGDKLKQLVWFIMAINRCGSALFAAIMID
jgi:hypothetical protein